MYEVTNPNFDADLKAFKERLLDENLNPPYSPPLSSELLAAAARYNAAEGNEYQRDIDQLAEHEPFAGPEYER